MAREVRVLAEPDFPITIFIESGSLHVVSWDNLHVSAQTHQKSPSHKPISIKQTGYNSIKFFAQLSFKKARSPVSPFPP